MKFEKCRIEGLLICKPQIFEDSRGFFSEVYRKDLIEAQVGKKLNFCQINISESSYGVLRGLHFQVYPFSQSKLVSVSNGKILDVVVDLRSNSKSFGEKFSVELNDVNNYQLYIPAGFAHGFSVLSSKAKISYQVDNFYNKNSEFGIDALDPNLNIDWKIESKKIIRSIKDSKYPILKDLEYFKF